MLAKIQDFLDLSPRLIRRFRLMGAESRKRRVGGVFTREELVEYLRKNKIRSALNLLASRKDGDPLPGNYIKEFGTWNEAKKAAFGAVLVKPGRDRKYILTSVIQSKAVTFRDYQEARRRNPDLIPSMYWVAKNFKTFGRMMFFISAMSFQRTLHAYARLTRRFGRPPTQYECEKAGVLTDVMIYVTGSKLHLDKYMARMEARRKGRPNEG